jgi:signal transduction histidine kinase
MQKRANTPFLDARLAVGPSQAVVGPAGPEPTNPRWPFIFVLLSLLILGGLPFLTIGVIGTYRADLERIDVARALMTDQHVAQARAGVFLRHYLERRDPTILNDYYAALTESQEARRKLGLVAEQLGRAVRQRYREQVRADSSWRQRITTLLREEPPPVDRIIQVMSDETLFERSEGATAQLERALSQAAAAERRSIDRAQRAALTLTGILVLLAAAAAVAVAWLSRRLRAFALAAETNRRELQNVLDARARMTRGLTHDLKNPLNAIVGHAELFEEGLRGNLTEKQREGISLIKRAAASMLGLLETLLELARVKSGNISIHKTEVNLQRLINEVAENYRASLEQEGMTLDTAVAGDAKRVVTDPARVAQVLDNLLSNAAKYTSSGHVEVRAETGNGAAPRRGQWVAIHVSDTGPGIAPERLEQIFDEFSRLGTEKASGAGLGLAMSRNLARLLGGDVTVQSQVNKGSTFTLWLPR